MNKFCKVCKDMGKPESVWKSHYVRETRHPDSPVTCPTILNNVCNYCNIKGHTISTCVKKKKDLKAAKKETFELRQKRMVVQIKAPPVKKSKNIFDALNDDSDGECEHERHVVEPIVFPKKRSINWALMADSDSDTDEE